MTENLIGESRRPGRIEVVCGSMFSGNLRRARFAKQHVAIFKPTMDVRYSPRDVVSHDHTALRSIPVHQSDEILKLSGGCDVVGIDEAQFFDDHLVAVCNKLAYQGVRVIIAGLDMDFLGNPFGPMPSLMAVADELAYASHRLVNDKEQVMLGEKQEYEPLCRDCFQKALLDDKRNAQSRNLFEK